MLKTVLLTGGTGFLGSNLIGQLVDNYHVVNIVRRSSDCSRICKNIDKITLYNIDEVKLDDIFRNEVVDIILHCATNYGRKEHDAVSLLEANLILPLKLLQLGHAHKVKMFVNTDTILDKRVSYYALSKSHFKDWLRTYSREMVCINIALEHFYGPNDDESKFATYIVKSLLSGVDEIDLTPGAQKRDFIYIDDVADAFVKVITCNSDSVGFYNYEVGSNINTSIRDFVEVARRLAGNNKTKLNFGGIPYRDNEVMESSVDTMAIRQLGWKPKIALEDGLRQTISFEKERNKS